MTNICDQTSCGPDDCTSPVMILQQGSTDFYPFVFHHGPLYEIESTQPGSGPTVKTKYPHCFQPGQMVHFIHQDNSPCPGDGGCAMIASVVDDYTVTLSGITTVAPGGSNGYIVGAMDLTGIRLEGSVRTRPINQIISTSGIKASGFAGSREVLIDGTCDVNIGDKLTIPSIGLLQATVLAVYKKEAQASAQTSSVSSVNSSRGCGCVVKPTTSVITSTQCDSVLVVLDQPLPSQIIDETGVQIDGDKLFDLSFAYHDDNPLCGIIHSTIRGIDTMNIPIQVDPNACSDTAVKVGMFSICLKRGWGNLVPDHYPQGNFDSDVINVRTGEVYVVPSYC